MEHKGAHVFFVKTISRLVGAGNKQKVKIDALL
jgi:hypothetical protein